MSVLTLDDFKRIMRKSAGEDDVSLDGEILDTEFVELGYDSLALLETAAIVKREYGVAIEDADLDAIQTPRDFLTRVNLRLAAA